MSSHLILGYEPGEYACDLGVIEGIEDDYELLRGIPRLASWPDDARFRMDDDFPDDLQVEDVIRNGNDVLVVSKRLREFLASRAPVNLEFLPVAIINHKGRRVKEPYWIAHPIHLVPCIDEERSVLEPNDINPELISEVEKLVLDETKIPPQVRVFRLARYPFILLVERALADELGAAGFSGLRFDELDKFQT